MAWLPEGGCKECEELAKKQEEIKKELDKRRKEKLHVDKTALS